MIQRNMRKFYTYLHCKPDGTPFYVGKGCCSINGRERSHHFKNRGEYHNRVTKKYGKENILVFVFPCGSEAQALSDERQQIAQLRSEGYKLCNHTDGGEGLKGFKHSDETRAKISAAAKNISDETRKKMSISHKGKILPVAQKLKISIANKGKICSAKTRNKLSVIGSGKKRDPNINIKAWNTRRISGSDFQSLETRLKISLSRMGKKHTEESRKKMSISAKARCARKALSGTAS